MTTTTKLFERKNVRVNGNQVSFTLLYNSRYGVIEKECSFIAKSEEEINKAKQLIK